jgi:pantetheine-phosphate adenylyltransferase
MALVNRDLAEVETVFLPANPEHGQISSSLVKQVADLEGSVGKYVTQAVARALASSSANRKKNS